MVIINLSILGVNLLGDESSTSNLSNNITNYVQYITIAEENKNMLRTVLEKSVLSLKQDKRYKNLTKEQQHKKKALEDTVESVISNEESNSKFLQDFSDRCVQELKEYSNECKKYTLEFKKSIKDLEDFYQELKNTEGFNMQMQVSNSELSD